MKLLTPELERYFNEIGRQEGKKDPLVIVKFFTSWTNWAWYATEYNPDDRTFF